MDAREISIEVQQVYLSFICNLMPGYPQIAVNVMLLKIPYFQRLSSNYLNLWEIGVTSGRIWKIVSRVFRRNH